MVNDRHLAPDSAREKLINMFEIPDPAQEEVLVFNAIDNPDKWINDNLN